jgi:hypothetical protein
MGNAISDSLTSASHDGNLPGQIGRLFKRELMCSQLSSAVTEVLGDEVLLRSAHCLVAELHVRTFALSTVEAILSV